MRTPDTGEQTTGVDLLAKRIRKIVARFGPVAHMEISQANVDVLYTGQSLLHSHILALRGTVLSFISCAL